MGPGGMLEAQLRSSVRPRGLQGLAPMLVARRVRVVSLLVFTLIQVGCAPARYSVRLQTAAGQVRVTTPAPRPPLVLPKEEVHRVVRALAQKVVPVTDPVELARERFEVPLREGVYL